MRFFAGSHHLASGLGPILASRVSVGGRSRASRACSEVAYSCQIVRRSGPSNDVPNQIKPAYVHLPQSTHRLGPPETLLDQLSTTLTDLVASMSSRPLIDSAAATSHILRNVWRDELSKSFDEIGRIVPPQKLMCDLALEKPSPILAEGRDVPDSIVHTQADDPAEKQVVPQLLQQHRLAANREEHLQQQRPQQLLGSDRRPAAPGVQLENSGESSLRISFTIVRTGRNG